MSKDHMLPFFPAIYCLDFVSSWVLCKCFNSYPHLFILGQKKEKVQEILILNMPGSASGKDWPAAILGKHYTPKQ